MADAISTNAPWTREGVDFLRRVEAGEIYTGLSGVALARWAVGLNDEPIDRPYDRADMARCLNVYWSAPDALKPMMRERIEQWNKRLRDEARGKRGWRWQPIDFSARRYYRKWDNLNDYWGVA